MAQSNPTGHKITEPFPAVVRGRLDYREMISDAMLQALKMDEMEGRRWKKRNVRWKGPQAKECEHSLEVGKARRILSWNLQKGMESS